jgi:hypothetical protein
MAGPAAIQRRLSFAGGSLGKLHRLRLGPAPELTSLALAELAPALLENARATWRERARGDFRALQILTRFLGEVTGAGDPLDVCAGVTALIDDKLRSIERWAAICEALGAPALLPEPVLLQDSPGFLASPMAERALATAITLLAINEPVSAGYRADLAARCRNPTIKKVLEDGRGEYAELGWSYIRQALRRFPPAVSPDWRQLVATALEPHETAAARTLLVVPANLQNLSAWPEPELADLGLLSPERQALVFHQLWVETIKPRLADTDLLPRRVTSGHTG